MVVDALTKDIDRDGSAEGHDAAALRLFMGGFWKPAAKYAEAPHLHTVAALFTYWIAEAALLADAAWKYSHA